MNRARWQDHAPCKGHGDLFFGPRYERGAKRERRERRALAICAQCPVMIDCRAAGRLGHETGIWGGETDEQRALAGWVPTAASTPVLRSVATHRRTLEAVGA